MLDRNVRTEYGHLARIGTLTGANLSERRALLAILTTDLAPHTGMALASRLENEGATDASRFVRQELLRNASLSALGYEQLRQLMIEDEPKIDRALDKAYRAANFYLRKTGATRDGEPFLAEQVRTQALLCQQWLRDALARPHPGATVAVTHFAPSLRSADPRYGLVPGTAGFCNALDELLPLAQLWLHGHLHCAQDYRVGNCRVVANPLGYAAKGEQAGFQPQCVLTI